MDFAVIAPVLLAGPIAVAHLPTTAAALVAATVWVTVAEAGRVTVMVLAVGAVGVPVARAPLRRTPLTRTVEPDTEVTVPVALANARRAAEPPPGALDGARDGAPEGRDPYEPYRPAPPAPAPPPAPFAGQAPLTLASMRTEVAVNALADPAAGAPVIMMQSPAAT
jgi:hypothetical protein